MLNKVIRFSLEHRMLVVCAAAVLLVYGAFVAARLSVDVFPDLNRPRVTILTDAHGMAPEEVETLVSLPIESLMNGATGVKGVRSESSIGFSLIHVEFDWGQDIYVARQIVAEKLQLAQERLPEDATTIMAPISSVMGEIMLIGLSSTGDTTPMELRTLADWVVRQRLLSVPGIAQVITMGGERKQFQVISSPDRLKQLDVGLDDLIEAVRHSNAGTSGGFMDRGSVEYLVRNVGRVRTAEDLALSAIESRDGTPVTIGDVASVRLDSQAKRGDASINASPAVIMSVMKQPNVNTVTLTREIDTALDEIALALTGDVAIDREVFRQSHFIESSIENVNHALRDAAILMAIVLFVFLANWRTVSICLLSIPLSIVMTALVFKWWGLSVNTMTLGGLAIAIGMIVDDSIINVENVFRRLIENRQKADPEPALQVVYRASSEVRNPILFATIIIILVFLPLFALGGMEGRMFVPLGIAYMVSLLASLIVSLTVVPALSYYLLPQMKGTDDDSLVVRWLKALQAAVLPRVVRRSASVIAGAVALIAVAGFLGMRLGREFLPTFNEGTLTITAVAPPGTSFAEGDRLGSMIEDALLEVPEVRSTSRRTGRADESEHAHGVNASEIDVALWTPELIERHEELGGREPPGRLRKRDEFLADIRERVNRIPGVFYDIGQPLSHRLDHLLSGVRTQVAVKIFGTDRDDLRHTAERIRKEMSQVEGVVDLYVEPQVSVPQLQISIDRPACARYGMQAFALVELLETALHGHEVAEVLDQQRTFDVMVRFAADARDSAVAIADMLIDTPSGTRVPLSQLARVEETLGPNTINRENVQRRIVVQCNTAGRDLNSVIHDIQGRIGSLQRDDTWPQGYFVEYGGQFESQQRATRQILLLSLMVVAAIAMMLYVALRSIRATAIVLFNLPLALVGGALALWITGSTLSVASLIGFITLLGIATRNGIMMISHYQHLMLHEGESFNESMVLRGTRERLRPVLMTAIVSALAMVPLALGAGETGKEILHPLAVVILGGLITSTTLDQIVTPTLYLRFGELEETHQLTEDPEE